MMASPKSPKAKRLSSLFGPGLITGAADDDPSGIATYSMAGAQLGSSILWLAFVTWPLMAGVQMMCARIGMITGKGLGANLRHKLPQGVLVLFSAALLVANTINIGADLYGMADAANMLCHLDVHFLVIVFGLLITVVTVRLRYQQIAQSLKWLALTLFAYVITVFLIGPDWSSVGRATFIPSWPHAGGWSMTVAILGTTISPYLFYWQSAEEVEEAKLEGRVKLRDRQGATEDQLTIRRWDVGIGTFFSNLIMYFIILAAALTLHKTGRTNIETSRQAAEALRPFAGDFASLLYAMGVIGVGFLAIPTLCGSAAYAFADTFRWRQGLSESLSSARQYYGIIILAMVVGMAIDFAQIKPIQALYWSAVINGLLAPFLLWAVLLTASDKTLMRGQPSSLLSQGVVLLTTLAMLGAAVGMFIF